MNEKKKIVLKNILQTRKKVVNSLSEFSQEHFKRKENRLSLPKYRKVIAVSFETEIESESKFFLML